MATKVTFRLPSRAYQYGFAEMEITHEGDLTPAQVGEMYVAAVLEYQIAEIAAKEAASAQEADFSKAVMTGLKASKVSEVKHEQPEAPKAPWEKPAPIAEAKPWTVPSFDFK